MSARKKKKKPFDVLDDELAEGEDIPELPVDEDVVAGEEEVAEVADGVDEIAESVVGDESVEPSPKAAGRKSIGVKEVIPFAWKLVGKSDGLLLTLYKAVEREEVEGQLERLRREKYYTDLQILPIAPPPPAAVSHAPAGRAKQESKEEKPREAVKKDAKAAKAPKHEKREQLEKASRGAPTSRSGKAKSGTSSKTSAKESLKSAGKKKKPKK